MEQLLTLYSEVQSTDVRWLWYPFIAIGKITLLQGDPGDGKSTMMMNLIAELSTGGKTPDGCKIGVPQKVIYQCSEDGVSDTIKPRLERCGADCRKIAFINEEVYNGLTLDDERIRQAIIEFRPRLVVIDPIQAYLGSDSDLQIAGRARKLMRRLGMWAAGYDCAIVLIGHLNKKEGSKGLYRSLGSIDVVAAARSVLQVERDTENPDVDVGGTYRMEEKSRTQELSVREISLIRELAQIRKEHKRELEYEKFDGYELPPRTQFSMLNKPAVSIKYGVMKFNMACIRLFEGIKYVLPILHPNKKRLALIMCPEEDSASVEWARQKDENWVNKDITSLEFVENIFRLMNWNRECRYKVLGRVANSDQGLCMLFDLEEAIMFTPKPQEYTDPLTGEMKKKQMKFFPDAYKNRIGKSYNDYIADHQMNMFEDFIGYQSSTVLDEPEREAGTTSIPIPQREESENIPLPDLPGQLENVQQSGNEIAERGMPT